MKTAPPPLPRMCVRGAEQIDAPVGVLPVSLGTRLIGDRWSLLIVREILVGASRVNVIHRGLPGLSRSLLSSRLRYPERIGVLEQSTCGDGGVLVLSTGSHAQAWHSDPYSKRLEPECWIGNYRQPVTAGSTPRPSSLRS